MPSLKVHVLAMLAAVGFCEAAAAQTPLDLAQVPLEDLMRLEVQRVFGASERLQPVTEAPSSVTIVTADDIAKYGYRSLADILRGVRGFYVTNDRNYSYVGVRGFARPGDYNTRVLLLVNGHRVNDNVYDQAAVGAEFGLDAANFERVEIIRGPASSLYGTSAFFAVINVITRTGHTNEGAQVDVDGGSLGTGSVRGDVAHTLSNGASIALSGSAERSRGVERLSFPGFDGYADHLDGEHVRNVYGRYTQGALSITGAYGTRDKDVPTASFFTIFNEQTARERTTDQHTMVDADYEKTLGRTRLVLNASYDRYKYDGIYPFTGENPDYPLLVQADSALGERWGVSGRATIPLARHNMLTAGGEVFDNLHQNQWDNYNDPAVEPFLSTMSSFQNAAFVQDEVRVRPWLILNGGLRFDHYTSFNRVTPRSAVIVTPSANQSFKYLYGRAFRAPNAYELSYYGPESPATLQPEGVDTHEVVWERYTGDWLRTSASAYRYNVSQLITLESVDADSPFERLAFVNDGQTRAVGIELEAEVRTKKGVQAVGSYAHQHAEDRSTGRGLTNSPATLAKFRATAPGPVPRSFGSFEWQYVSRRTTLSGSSVDPSSIVNLTAGVHLSQSLMVSGTAHNVFDQRYADPASDEHSFDAIQQNGRTLRVGLRWSLWTR